MQGGPQLSFQDQEEQELGGRRLQQGGVTPTTVATAQDLIAAVTDGSQHIQITAHLDLSALPVQSNPLHTNPNSKPAGAFEHAVYANSSVTNTLVVRPACAVNLCICFASATWEVVAVVSA